MHADATAGGHDDVAIMERVAEVWQAAIGKRRCDIDIGRTLHTQCFMRSFTIEFVNEVGGLSPPFNLRSAVEAWLRQAVTADDIVQVLDEHMHRCRATVAAPASACFESFRTSQVGLEAKRPAPERAPAQPQRPQRA